MRSLSLIIFITFIFSSYVKSQTCTGGGAATSVTWDLTGLVAQGTSGTSGNSTGTICFPGGTQMAVVGDIWDNLTITTSNGSYCDEAAIAAGNTSGGSGGWSYTFFNAANSGPCGSASFPLEDYNLAGGSNVFNTDASGCIHFQIFDTYNDSGLDFTFNSGTITFFGCPVGQVLPLNIIKIQADNIGKSNLITWSTASETNNDVQIVEKSTDGTNSWEQVGKVKGTNVRETVTYNVNDEDPNMVSFYRIRSVDFDGREQLSEIVSVIRKMEGGHINSIQPNPTSNFVKFDIIPSSNDDIQYLIRDITGKLQKSIKMYGNGGTLNSHIIEMSDLQNGLYMISIEGGGINENTKVLKY